MINYYSLACNTMAMIHFRSLMKYSMLKTFAAKYRTKVSKIKSRYEKNGEFTVPYNTKSGIKLKAKTCEVCGINCDDIEIHQVKRLKEVNPHTIWGSIMLERHRKTLAVCPACHEIIHQTMKS